MKENEISYLIRGAVFEVYNTLGPGFLEIVYEEALIYEFKKLGLKVQKQVELPLFYKGVNLERTFRLDLLAEGKVILELKSVSELNSQFHKQLSNYLKLSNLKLGLLVNFGSNTLHNNIKRIVNDL